MPLPICAGIRSSQQPSRLFHRRNFVRFRRFPLLRPAVQLAREIRFLATEIAEPDRIRIEPVQLRQHVDHVHAERVSIGHRDALGRGRIVQHQSVDELHHVERRAVDRGIAAQSIRRRDRHRGFRQRRDDLVLASHVVGAFEHVSERRTTQHVSMRCRVFASIREIRVAAGDQRELHRRFERRHVRAQPLRHAIGVDSFHHVAPNPVSRTSCV